MADRVQITLGLREAGLAAKRLRTNLPGRTGRPRRILPQTAGSAEMAGLAGVADQADHVGRAGGLWQHPGGRLALPGRLVLLRAPFL